MHKNLKKALTGSLLSAAMLATTVCSAIAPMSASAEIEQKGAEQLGATTFDDNVGLPWHTCETNPAKQKFDIVDGQYVMKVISNGPGAAGRWDLQFRHRGLNLISGHKYYVHAEITCSSDGYVYSKIGNYAGNKEYWNDAGEGDWQPVPLKAGETFIIDTTFTATNLEEGKPAEWAFHYADHSKSTSEWPGSDTGVPEGETITFDNMSLQDLSGGDPVDTTLEYGVIRPKSNVRLNQVGYFTGLRKRASYTTDASEPLTFHVMDKSGTEVYKGTSTIIKNDIDSGTPETTQVKGDGGKMITRYKDAGKYVHVLDFTKCNKTGEGFYIIVDDKTGISGTQYSIYEGAFDTKISGDKVMWTNWKTKKEYQMNKSHPFAIGDKIYGDLVRDSISYFYQNRSGVPVEAQYIKNGPADELAHTKYGHNPDKAYVQPKWIKTYASTFNGDETYSITATGGWYDAGDHGKYVVNGGVSVWTLQNLYEMSKKIGTDSKWDDGKTALIPENKNGAPDILDEARVELEWFFDMIVDGSDPYWGDSGKSAKATGLVYHKLHDSKWTGLGVYAWDYGDFKTGMQRIVKPPTYAATFNTIACAAQAARLWKGIDDDFADECLSKAKSCLAAVEKLEKSWNIACGSPLEQDDVDGKNLRGEDPLFAPLDQAIGGGPYGDTYVADDYYWALCELFATTGDEEYLTKLKKYENPNDSTGQDKALSLTSNLGGGENKGSFSSFNWGCTSGLGTLSLYLNSDKLSSSDAKTVKDSIVKVSDAYIKQEDNSGMGIPYVGSTFTDEINIGVDENGKPIEVTGYEWGSNSFVANNAIVMAYAYDATKDAKYLSGATTAMDYIFGRNGNDFSYVSGYGDTEMGTTLQWPHHRYWSHGVDPDFPMAPIGILSGGPGAGMQDPYVGGLGYKRGAVASQKCYVDSAEAWSVNEITINWNAPLVWMASYLEDVAPGVIDDGSGSHSENPTDPATGTTPKDGVWGDADMDGVVKMNDAVLIMQSLSNPDKYGLEGSESTHITSDGKYWGDVESNGNGITAKDALQIQKWLLKLVDSLDPTK